MWIPDAARWFQFSSLRVAVIFAILIFRCCTAGERLVNKYLKNECMKIRYERQKREVSGCDGHKYGFPDEDRIKLTSSVEFDGLSKEMCRRKSRTTKKMFKRSLTSNIKYHLMILMSLPLTVKGTVHPKRKISQNKHFFTGFDFVHSLYLLSSCC